MAIELDSDELELFVMNDYPSYERGLRLAGESTSDKEWRRFVHWCVQRYRMEVGLAKLVKGTVCKAAAELCGRFLEVRADIERHEASKQGSE